MLTIEIRMKIFFYTVASVIALIFTIIAITEYNNNHEKMNIITTLIVSISLFSICCFVIIIAMNKWIIPWAIGFSTS